MKAAAALAALLLLAVVLQDAFEVMLLPRRVTRKYRLTRLYFRVAWYGWSSVAARLPKGGRREGFLSVFGALSMVTLFAAWSSALIVGFGFLGWALQ
jgi:nitrate reductase NapE component